jgi:hypothetical protein
LVNFLHQNIFKRITYFGLNFLLLRISKGSSLWEFWMSLLPWKSDLTNNSMNCQIYNIHSLCMAPMAAVPVSVPLSHLCSLPVLELKLSPASMQRLHSLTAQRLGLAKFKVHTLSWARNLVNLNSENCVAMLGHELIDNNMIHLHLDFVTLNVYSTTHKLTSWAEINHPNLWRQVITKE